MPPPAKDVSTTGRASSLYDHTMSVVDVIERAISTHALAIGNTNTRKKLIYAATMYGALKSLREVYQELVETRSFEVKIDASDPLYDVVQSWMIEEVDKDNIRSVIAQSVDTDGALVAYNDEPISPTQHTNSSKERPRKLRLYYNDRNAQVLYVDGHKISVRVNYAPGGGSVDYYFGEQKDNVPVNRRRPANSITLICRTSEARVALIRRMESTLEALDNKKRVGRVYIGGKYGFSRRTKAPARPMSSVVLKEGQAERIMGAVKDFLAQEEQYIRLAIPYRLGILLKGMPGTGKTSIATALAHELSRDVFVLNLSSIDEDSDLLEHMNEVNPGSILLIEDFDVVRAARVRDDSTGGVTMSGILNALDGIATPEGLIIILTTNRADVIDPAIIRPGRVDVNETIGYLDDYQLRKFCETFVGFVPEDLPTITEDDMITPATLSECVKNNFKDPLAMADSIINTVKERKCIPIESSIRT